MKRPPPVSLSDDLVAEILLLLPTKSLARVAAVCKQWRRVAADPVFLPARARRAPPLQLLSVRYRRAPSRSGDADTVELSVLDVVVPAAGAETSTIHRRRLARCASASPVLARGKDHAEVQKAPHERENENKTAIIRSQNEDDDEEE
uniref:F-box domain-containing protein n=1 Tax=Leersia perrieri TaxID=77586 RepID=A0A0D9VU02_9ORYZ